MFEFLNECAIRIDRRKARQNARNMTLVAIEIGCDKVRVTFSV